MIGGQAFPGSGTRCLLLCFPSFAVWYNIREEVALLQYGDMTGGLSYQHTIQKLVVKGSNYNILLISAVAKCSSKDALQLHKSLLENDGLQRRMLAESLSMYLPFR